MPATMPAVEHRPGRDAATEAVTARGVQKVYGATRALVAGDLSVRPGEIHALLGENGAGKSTLVRILAGIERADRGELNLFGEPIGDRPAAARAELGAAFIHQDLGLVELLSVADNVALGTAYARRFGLIDQRATRQAARAVLARLGVELDVDRLVGELPPAEQAIVAIARALALGARLIVLDEPTAKLHAGEVQALFALLSRLRDEGVACLLITHRIDDVLAVCDRVTVLRDGRTVASRAAGELGRAELVALIVGRDAPGPTHHAEGAHLGEPALELRGLRGPGYGPISLELAAGEIVALTGLADAGHRAVAQALSGAAAAAAGDVIVAGRRCRLRRPVDALAHGIGYLPDDRRAEGLAMELTAGENLFLCPGRSGLSRHRHRAERLAAQRLLAEFDVRPPEPDRAVETFSGGNQQKILLARCLARAPRVLVLNEPTAAVDIGAKFDIYRLLRQRCAEDGLAALVVTSDFEEAVTLCDRVVVMRRGAVVATAPGGEAELAVVTELAYGGAA